MAEAIQGSVKVSRLVRRVPWLIWPLDTIRRLAVLGATVALAGNGNRLAQGPMVGVLAVLLVHAVLSCNVEAGLSPNRDLFYKCFACVNQSI